MSLPNEPDSQPSPLVSVSVSPFCEMARWLLERISMPYIERCHAPLFSIIAVRLAGGNREVPVLVTKDGAVAEAWRILDYCEAHSSQQQRLYPEDSAERAEVERLFRLFYDRLAIIVRRWGYAYLLPVRSVTSRMMTAKSPFLERVIIRLTYPIVARLMRKALKIDDTTPQQDFSEINEIFAEVEALLADGRKYLTGDRFSAADLAFASLAAPTVMPDGYTGPLPKLDQLPEKMRAEVEEFRAHAAGRFLLRVYKEQRSLKAAAVA